MTRSVAVRLGTRTLALGLLGACTSPPPAPLPSDAGLTDGTVSPDRAPASDRQPLDAAEPDRPALDATTEADGRVDSGESSRSDGASLCAELTAGALITFQTCGDLFTLWITRPAFIDEALRTVGKGRGRIPVFSLLDGRQCDPRWSWHVDPQAAEFADATIEVCQGCPAFVESNKTYWLTQVKNYCPTAVEVISVQDRR